MDGGATQEGRGWAFVEPLLGDSGWKQHHARVVVQPRRIWVAAGKFGLQWEVTDICVLTRPTAGRSKPFGRDGTVELLAGLAPF